MGVPSLEITNVLDEFCKLKFLCSTDELSNKSVLESRTLPDKEHGASLGDIKQFNFSVLFCFLKMLSFRLRGDRAKEYFTVSCLLSLTPF